MIQVTTVGDSNPTTQAEMLDNIAYLLSNVSYSSIASFLTCRRKFFYEYILAMRPVTEPLAPVFGRVMHEAVNVWFASRDINAAIACFEANYIENLQVDDVRTIRNAARLLRKYATQYQEDNLVVLPNTTEQKFLIPISDFTPDNAVVHVVGRFDRVVQFQGMVVPMETKTTTRLGYQYFKQFAPNYQIDLYAWAFTQLYSQVPPGCLIDALKVAKGEVEVARDFISVADAPHRFISNLLPILHDMRKCLLSIQSQIQAGKFEHLDLHDLYLNTTQCTMYGECMFRGIDILPEDDRLQALYRDYTKRRHN